MAVTVLGIAAAGVLLPFAGGARVRAEGVHKTLGVKLASDLMEEIVNMPFDEIVASYNGYSESQGQVKDAAGQIFTDTDSSYANFSREVSCGYATVPQESDEEDQKFIHVTVLARYSGRVIATVNRLVSR